MSYCIQQTDSNFKIEAVLMPQAANALRKWSSRFDTKPLETCPHCKQAMPTDEKGLLSFEKLMEEVYFEVEVDNDGGVTYLSCYAENLFDNLEVVLKILAPFVTEGSYLQFCGEGTDHWRYVFEGGKMTENHGEVSFG